jgi:cytochrome c-type biogenesis protein
MDGDGIGVALAFAGGVLSFLSPCVLPLAPPYLAYLSGRSLDDMTDPGREERLVSRLSLAAVALMAVAFWRLIAGAGDPGALGAAALIGAVGALAVALARDPVTRSVFAAALAFVAGLATVFVTLGATASALGQLLLQNKATFALAAGLVIYVLGQHFIGLRRAPSTAAAMFGLWLAAVWLQGAALGDAIAESWPALALFAAAAAALRFSGLDHIPLLQREARFTAGRGGGSLAGAYVVGLAFAFGWTPCIGPILGAVLAVAGQRDSIGEGVTLLAFYAAGLGLPFLIAALYVRPFMRFMRGFRRHMGRVETAMGGVLVCVGLLMATGRFEVFAFWLLETFPALGTIG